jgi:plastocyanin
MVAKLVVSDGAATPPQSSENATTQGTAANNQSSMSANTTTAGSNTTTATSAASASPASGSVTIVSIIVGASVPTNGQFYEPNDVETTIGSMVTWVNADTAPHIVTSGMVENNRPRPDGGFDSGIMNSGDSLPFVFDKAGEYPYYYTIHPWMTDRVTSS